MSKTQRYAYVVVSETWQAYGSGCWSNHISSVAGSKKEALKIANQVIEINKGFNVERDNYFIESRPQTVVEWLNYDWLTVPMDNETLPKRVESRVYIEKHPIF